MFLYNMPPDVLFEKMPEVSVFFVGLVFLMDLEAFRAQYKYGASQPLKKYSITEQIIHKNNRNLHGIIVRAPGNRIAPVFYYSRHQSSADNFCRRIIPFYGFEHDIIGILKAKRVQAGNQIDPACEIIQAHIDQDKIRVVFFRSEIPQPLFTCTGGKCLPGHPASGIGIIYT